MFFGIQAHTCDVKGMVFTSPGRRLYQSIQRLARGLSG
jgi:hypothetical protein